MVLCAYLCAVPASALEIPCSEQRVPAVAEGGHVSVEQPDAKPVNTVPYIRYNAQGLARRKVHYPAAGLE